MAGLVLPLRLAHESAEESLDPMEKSDSYGEWIIRKVQQEAGWHESPLPAQVISAACAVWPRVAALVANELKREGSVREAQALAAEIWEGALRSVAKVVQRNGSFASAIRDPESYLLWSNNSPTPEGRTRKAR